MSTVKRAADTPCASAPPSQKPTIDSYESIVKRSFAVFKALTFNAEKREDHPHRFCLKIDPQTGEWFEAFEISDPKVSPQTSYEKYPYIPGCLKFNTISKSSNYKIKNFNLDLSLPMFLEKISMQSLRILHIMKKLASGCLELQMTTRPPEIIMHNFSETTLHYYRVTHNHYKENLLADPKYFDITVKEEWDVKNQIVDFGPLLKEKKCLDDPIKLSPSSLPYTTGELVVLKGEGGNFFERWNPTIRPEDVVARWQTDESNPFSKT